MFLKFVFLNYENTSASDDEDNVKELKDHIPEDSELSSYDDDNSEEIEFTENIYFSKDKLIKYGSKPSFQAGKRASVMTEAFIFHVESHPVQTDSKQAEFLSFKRSREDSYNLFCLFVFYCGPLSVIVYCYCRVLWVIWKRSKLAKNSIEDNRSETSSHCIFRLSDTRLSEKLDPTLKMTFLIVISFFFCWTPYVIIDLWYLFDSESAEKLDTRIQSSMFMFAVFNSCINPLVYGSYIFNFKDSLKNLFRCRRLQLRSGQSNSQIPRRVTSEDRLGRGTDEYRSSQPGEVILELREATPVRRPLSRRNLTNVHRTEENLVLNSCDNSQCDYCRSNIYTI
ncbi:Gonadotropin-releasing hormone II receptor like protein [Argiope bruennichi]|uniref:Gonadotropin-releasing hormone II receptor like protein n=1 Tax=Argiope bruennichi TaxID=94029 RepID=A0A8T0FRM7_ARGBR|nr:Gonadotropin-releasing hormone II receptor like protein [Argiope bruennichi]